MSPVEAAAGILSAAAPVEEEGGEEDFYLPEDNKEELDEWYVIPEEEIPPVQLNGEPMVLIYNTHNAESYKPTQGVSKMDGKNGGVAAVSKTVTGLLASKYSIKTEYSEAIHDYPDWTKSYVNSMHTVKNYLKKYQKLQAVIDIHRDAGLQTRGDTLVKINGMQCAKVMIVIGAEHPRWKQNLAFAQKIESKANQLYPGLIKSIRLRKDRRYNQNLHPRAILLEFGSDLNKQEDAVNSAKLMADVLAAVLKSN
jgi:stage II sporulation protein P